MRQVDATLYEAVVLIITCNNLDAPEKLIKGGDVVHFAKAMPGMRPWAVVMAQ